MNLVQARAYADLIRTTLAPACERIEIAGSIRRAKSDGIKDIEMVAIAKPARAVFGQPPVSPLHALTDSLLGDDRLEPPTPHVLSKRLDKNGRAAWGLKYRRAFWHLPSTALYYAIPLDLFICESGNFGAILTIRTGPDDFSHRLVTPRRFGGAMPDGMRQQDGWLMRIVPELRARGLDDWQAMERVDTPDEESFFAALSLPWLSPELRTEERLIEILKGQKESVR